MPPSSAEVRVSAGSYWIGNPLPIWAMLSGLSKNFGSMRHLISRGPLIHLMSDCLRGGSIRASPTRLHSEGHSAFPDQRMAPLNSDSSTWRILSCVLQEQNVCNLWGYLGIVGWNL